MHRLVTCRRVFARVAVELRKHSARGTTTPPVMLAPAGVCRSRSALGLALSQVVSSSSRNHFFQNIQRRVVVESLQTQVTLNGIWRTPFCHAHGAHVTSSCTRPVTTASAVSRGTEIASRRMAALTTCVATDNCCSQRCRMPRYAVSGWVEAAASRRSVRLRATDRISSKTVEPIGRKSQSRWRKAGAARTPGRRVAFCCNRGSAREVADYATPCDVSKAVGRCSRAARGTGGTARKCRVFEKAESQPAQHLVPRRNNLRKRPGPHSMHCVQTDKLPCSRKEQTEKRRTSTALT